MHDIGKLSGQVERLISDVGDQSAKLDDVRHKISFVRGAVWVMSAVMALMLLVAGWFASGQLSVQWVADSTTTESTR